MYCKNCRKEFDVPYRWYDEKWDEDYVQCPFCHSEEICDEYELEYEEDDCDAGYDVWAEDEEELEEE